MSKDIKTPSMLIYLKPEYSTNIDIATEVKNTFEYTELQDILLSSEIIYLPDIRKGNYDDEEKSYDIYEEMMDLMEMECPDSTNLSKWVYWMEFDSEAMLQKGIYMQDVYDEVINRCNVDTEFQCVVPDMNSDRLTMRIRARQDFSDGSDYIAFFKQIGDCLLKLPLRGINGVSKVYMEKVTTIRYKEDGSPENVQEWVLKTDGSNLVEVLSNDYVDIKRTTTNDIAEIHSLFGIEGARHAIIKEMEATIANGGVSEIDFRHFALLADLMTYRGIVMQIQRHGFGKSPYIGTLGRATNEVMDKILINAGIFAENDDMEGTSANIIMGQAVKTGTNSFNLLMNVDMLPEGDEMEVKESEMEVTESGKDEMEDMEDMVEPLESLEGFDFEKAFEQKELSLDDYLREIGKSGVDIEDSDFNFGYDLDNFEEEKLPEMGFDNVQLEIEKVVENNVNRRRRKK